MKKRAITITTPEVSTIFFGIATLLMFFGISQLLNMNTWASINGMDNLSATIITTILIIFIMFFFFLIAVSFPVYQIVKNNLFIFMDRISNPDFVGWFGFNRNKKFYPQIVNIGSFGNTEGVMNDENADVINDGEYTTTTTNGNQAIIVNDMLTTNINLNNAVGWNLIKKHFGVVGFKAYELAMNTGETMFPVEEKKPMIKKEKQEEVVSDGNLS